MWIKINQLSESITFVSLVNLDKIEEIRPLRENTVLWFDKNSKIEAIISHATFEQKLKDALENGKNFVDFTVD